MCPGEAYHLEENRTNGWLVEKQEEENEGKHTFNNTGLESWAEDLRQLIPEHGENRADVRMKVNEVDSN